MGRGSWVRQGERALELELADIAPQLGDLLAEAIDPVPKDGESHQRRHEIQAGGSKDDL